MKADKIKTKKVFGKDVRFVQLEGVWYAFAVDASTASDSFISADLYEELRTESFTINENGKIVTYNGERLMNERQIYQLLLSGPHWRDISNLALDCLVRTREDSGLNPYDAFELGDVALKPREKKPYNVMINTVSDEPDDLDAIINILFPVKPLL